MPTLEPKDQIYALSLFSNAAQDAYGSETLDRIAYQQVTKAIENACSSQDKRLEPWNIVWGPAAAPDPTGPGYAMNVMYVAQKVADNSQYVIAVAGTNMSSILDELVEDDFVSVQVPWLYGKNTPPKARISIGTALALGVLQNMKPTSQGLPGKDTTLVEFLKPIVSQNQKVQITVAGHSLGGALAPAVGLWLADTQEDRQINWDPEKNATIFVQPTGGPTPGNSAFARHAGDTLGDRLTPYYNVLDPIPRAWSTHGSPSLDELPWLYPDYIEPTLQMFLLFGAAKALVLRGDYTPLPGLQPFLGKFNSDPSVYPLPSQEPGLGPKIPMKIDFNLYRYILQMAYQHIDAYHKQFNYDPSWVPPLPAQGSTNVASERYAALDAVLSQKSATPSTILQKLRSREPRTIRVGAASVDAPKGPDDPQAARVVALVEAELAKHGSWRSSAT